MANLPISVLRFAVDHGDGMKELVDNFVDFYNQHRAEQWGHKTQFITEYKGQKISFAEKERAIDGMILREMGKMAGVDVTSMKAEQMMSHPVVKWAAVNIVSQLIDAVLPDTMVQGTGAYAEVISRDLGETYVADIKSRDLFAVTKSGRGVGQRHAEIHRALTRQVVINPEGHQITVGVNLFRVLTGQESLAEFTTKAMRSMETEVTKDIYTAFAAVMANLSTTASTGLRVSGYTMADLTKLSQKVSSFSGGAKPIVMGTKVALANVVPDNTNYRYDIESPFATVGYVRTIAGIDTFEIPQIADWTNPFSTYVSDSRLWIIAPSTDKIIKCVLGGSTIATTDDQFASANLQIATTFTKNWKAAFASSSLGAEIDL